VKNTEEKEIFRDRISTVNKEGQRNWVYALKPKGIFYNYRIALAFLYFIVFFSLPFIKVNGEPFLMLNIVEGKFIWFSKIFWPQDFFIFAIAMITFIVFIILFTIIYGRLFCGWVCPQTVFMEFIFRPIEWLIEGSPNSQKKLKAEGWTANKIIRKTLKHTLYLLISFAIAHTFLAYILGIDHVVKIIREPLADHLVLLSGLIIFTLLFYGVFAFVREIVCTTICPYGRLQSVMTDKNTMQISYDYHRGEPRGRFRKNEVRSQGDCVDCLKCIQVCPTNIDIRNGVQMECVGCTACIDACDEVMDSLNFKRGLIRYASENQIHDQKEFKFNNRIKAYSALLLLLIGFMVFLVIRFKHLDCYISRVKGQLYQETATGGISNLFEAKIINKTNRRIPVTLRLDNLEGHIKIVGRDSFNLEKEKVNDFTFFLEIPASQIHERSTDINFGLYEGEERIQTISSKFLGPFK